MPRLLIIPGSLRAASASKAAARAITQMLGDAADCVTADISALPLYNADVTHNADVAAFIASVAEADGVVLITPEYNYSVPGVLKNAIDWASRPAFQSVFKDKPCFVMSISGGALGGVRAQGHLKYTLNGMLAKIHAGKEIVVTFANDKVQGGVLVDENVMAFTRAELDSFLATLG